MNNWLLWFTNVFNGYVRESFMEKWDEHDFNVILTDVIKYIESEVNKNDN